MKIMNTEWTKEFPNEPGTYWLCGWRFTRDKVSGPAKLYLVTVLRTPNSLAYVCDGAFLYLSEGVEGLWTPAVIPDLPDIEPHFYRGGMAILKQTAETHIVDNVDYSLKQVFTRPVDASSCWATWRDFDEFKFADE